MDDMSGLERALNDVAPIPPIALYEKSILNEPFLLLLDRRSLIDATLISDGPWGDETIGLFQTYIEPFLVGAKNPVFFDIGSYWGSYSIYFARKGWFAEIHAFDADALNYSQLQTQLFLNQLSFTVNSRHVGISERCGRANLFKSLDHPEGNRGGVGLNGIAETDDVKSTISTIRIDDEYTFTDRKIVIKIDVEGHEVSVIKGMQILLADNDVLLQIEAFENHDPILDELMQSYGYEKFDRVADDSFYRKV